MHKISWHPLEQLTALTQTSYLLYSYYFCLRLLSVVSGVKSLSFYTYVQETILATITTDYHGKSLSYHCGPPTESRHWGDKLYVIQQDAQLSQRDRAAG